MAGLKTMLPLVTGQATQFQVTSLSTLDTLLYMQVMAWLYTVDGTVTQPQCSP